MSKTMKAVIKPEQAPGMRLAEVPIPEIGPTDALIKVQAASICGTDLHIYKWDPWARKRIRPPLVVGHEFCGTVVATGRDVHEVKEGDFISAESHIICGHCPQCRTGNGHICQNHQIIGVDRDGCWAEYIVMPEYNLWPNPPDMPPEIACMLENFGNAVHTAFATDLTARKVLITGCGPVGLMTVAVAKAAGARAVYATDISPYRLRLARQMGATHTLNVAEVDVVEFILDDTAGEGVDVLLEMSGASSAIDQGFTVLRDGGEAALLGLTAAPIGFDINNHIIFKGATVYGITGRKLWDTWFRMSGLIDANAVDLGPLVTHRFTLEQWEDAITVMGSGASGKVVMFLNQEESSNDDSKR
ncbi:MAG: L-threonine 3-dehydrogenase [Chloroflexota bacterium]|nr:L-threonine 3-dehydrogenase [Chloroflexota bacterium]